MVFDVFIRRPVFATVLSLIVLLIGLVSYTRLTVREYPNIDEPQVSVRTDYPGASAEIIETQVTQVLENSIAGIEGIEVITSSSRQERSQISVTFRADADPDVAASDVRDRVGRVRGRLPEAVDEPVISKVEADAQPVLYLALTSDRHSALEISDFADRFVSERLRNSPGVAEVRILGERRYAMRIWIDRARLAAYNLTTQDVETALREQNVEIPAGRIEGQDREFTVLSDTGLSTPEQFRSIIVKNADGFLVRIGDIATVELGAADSRRVAWLSGQQSVTLGLVKQATANPLDVSAGVRERLPDIVAKLPAGMNLIVAYDSSIFIERSIRAVFTAIGEAVALVVVVILFFLRSFRATIIPIVTIPASLIGAFTLMYLFGFSINTLTLLALVLAVGLVVDDAIVVLENIHHHIEQGMKPKAAAIRGINEIAFAVVAMTLTLVAVYAPMVFSSGRTGKLFVEFALTLAGAVVISGFIALTLTPMMCSQILKEHERHGGIYLALERGFDWVAGGYRRLLGLAFRARPLVIVLALAAASGIVYSLSHLKSELSPVEDRGSIMVFGSAPEGSTVAFTAGYAREFAAVYAQVPEVETNLIIVGFPDATSALSFVRLKAWEERTRSQQAIAGQLQGGLMKIPGIRAFASNPPSLGQSSRSKPVQFVIQTSESYETLDGYVNALIAELRKVPSVTNVDSDLRLNKPQIYVALDREKLADNGLKVSDVGRTLETMLGGRQVTRFEMNGDQYDVIVQLADADRARPRDLASIFVRNASGEMIQLSNLVTIAERVAPKELNRFNQQRAAIISAIPAPGFSLGESLADIRAAAERVLPGTVQTDLAGESREFQGAGRSLYLVGALSLVFIFLVLAAQFESWINPTIIMLSVPLSITGALFTLYLAGGTLNVYSQIGLVTLIGLITKHGILIVEFANQMRETGADAHKAVIEASVRRLRPIIMTTGAMVFGALPLAFAHGAGAESRQQIGWVIVGGMSFGTLFTLFVVPTAYTYLARNRRSEEDEATVSPGELPAEPTHAKAAE